MCGRFTLHSPQAQIAQEFGVATLPLLIPRFNIAPTQPIAIVRLDPATQTRCAAVVRWGLIPSWASDPKIGQRMINARSETVADKPAFRAAFRRRRCLVPADGYYEWQKTPAGKQPFLIHDPTGHLLALAGLWETWQAPDGSLVESCALLTTSANPALEAIHDRMPVLLAAGQRDQWLDPATPSPALQALLVPAPATALSAFPVSTRVNSPTFDDPRCLEPVA